MMIFFIHFPKKLGFSKWSANLREFKMKAMIFLFFFEKRSFSVGSWHAQTAY